MKIKFLAVMLALAFSLGCASEMAKLNKVLTKAEVAVQKACDDYQKYLNAQAALVTSISDKTVPIEDTVIRLARDVCAGARAVVEEAVPPVE